MGVRKRISASIRQKIYDKYKGHCAYCGQVISLREMQVDHIFSVRKSEFKGVPVDDSLENYMPACRACNFYKSTLSLEDFRNQISTIHSRLEKGFIYKLARKYGMVEEKPMPKFYFER